MGLYVYVTVSFQCEDADALSALASRMLVELNEEYDDDHDLYLGATAENFLNACIEKRGHGHGAKGSVFTYGEVGNYTSANGFVYALEPFWAALKASRVLVFLEREDSGAATAYEIGYGGSIRESTCDFMWDQN